MTNHFRCEASFSKAIGDDSREPLVRRPSRALRRVFSSHGVTLPEDAIVETSSRGWAWNLVQRQGEHRRYLYSIARQHDHYVVWQRTPSGYGSDLFQEHVFSLWEPSNERMADVFELQRQSVNSIDTIDWIEVRVDERVKFRRYYRTGRERATLADDKQRRKWDYFFRPASLRIGLNQKRLIWGMQRELSEHEQRIGARKLGIYLLSGLLGGLVLLLTLSGYSVSLLLLSVVAYFDLRWLWEIMRRRGASRRIRQWIRDFQSEIEALEAQVPADVPRDEQIHGWLMEDIRNLAADALKHLKLDEKQILRVSDGLDAMGVRGIPIWDWGLLQSGRLPGRLNLNPFHLFSLWPGRDGKPRFAVYYVQLIFPMERQLAVCGFYYDFIRRERRGESVAEYFYRNVVAVRSGTVEEPNPFDPDRQRETTTFQLQVASGDSITIALTDETVVRDLNKLLEAREEIRREEQASQARDEAALRGSARPISLNGHRLSEAEYGRRLEVAEADLPATIGRNARDFILKELRARG